MPVVLLFSVVIIVPLFQSVNYSFFAWNGLNTEAFVKLDNYAKMFSAREFSTSVINSLVYALILVVYQVGMSLLLASLLTQSKIKGKQLFRNLYFVPVLLSISVVATAVEVDLQCGLRPDHPRCGGSLDRHGIKTG